jgi:hypothetical protein
MSTPREIQVGVAQGSILSLTLYSMYINYTPQTSGVYLALFADDTCMYATDRKDLRKMQRGLNSIETWCKRWNMKMNEKTRAVYFSHRPRPPEAHKASDLHFKNGRFVS